MKGDIICDTNVWYDLGAGRIDPEKLVGHALVATFYNFEELVTTPNIVGKFSLVKGAARAIVNHSNKQILENAFLHIARTIDPQYEDRRYSYNLGIRNWVEVRRIAELSDSFQLTPELETEYKMNIQSRTNNGEVVAAIENQFVLKVKAHSKKLYKENKSRYFKKRFQGILFELNDYLKAFSDGRVDLRNKNLKNFELFLTAFLQLSKNAEIARWVVQPNDAYDLYNLIYVKPGDKYFTKEARWTNLITEAGLAHYLFTD